MIVELNKNSLIHYVASPSDLSTICPENLTKKLAGSFVVRIKVLIGWVQRVPLNWFEKKKKKGGTKRNK